MSFYRRYRGTRDVEAAVRPVVPGPAEVQSRQPVGEIQQARAPVFPPPPTEIETFRPPNPPPPKIPFLTEDPRVVQSLAPPGSQSLFPVAHGPEVYVDPVIARRQQEAAIRLEEQRRYEADLQIREQEAARLQEEARLREEQRLRAEEIRLREDEARRQAVIRKTEEDARAWEAYRAAALEVQRQTQAAPPAVRQAAEAQVLQEHVDLAKQREAEKAAVEAARVATEAAFEAGALATREAEARAAAAAQRADRAAQEAVQSQPPADFTRNYTDPSAANYVDPAVPLTAWDQVDPAEAIPLPDGTVAMVAKSPSLLPLVAAAGGGFLVGGPIGGLVGAAAGYFLTKPKRASRSIAWYHR